VQKKLFLGYGRRGESPNPIGRSIKAVSIEGARRSGTEQKDTLAMTNIIQDTHYATAFETDPATVVAIDKQPFAG
jgi:hypothetical protein